MSEAPRPVVLVDGSAYLFRAFHAMERQGREMSTSAGAPTEAIYVVLNMVRKLVASYRPDHMAMIFDASGKTFRDELYPDYKANRSAMPERLRAQIEPLYAVVRAMGMPLLVVEGVEADDVIGTLATRATAAGLDTVISTGDKDMAQLVDERVTLVNTMTDTVMDVAAVRDKFGVEPGQIIDYLALVGDSVDNIPGVPSCGPKTAAKWLAAHGSLDGVIENADSVKGKIGEKLRDSLEQLPLSYRLATILTDVELPTDIDGLKPVAADNAALAELYRTLEFRSWHAEVLDGRAPDLTRRGETPSAGEAEPTATAEQPDTDYTVVRDRATLDEWIARLEAAEIAAFDTETTSLDYMQADIVGVSFAVEPGVAAYVPLAHLIDVSSAAADGADRADRADRADGASSATDDGSSGAAGDMDGDVASDGAGDDADKGTPAAKRKAGAKPKTVTPPPAEPPIWERAPDQLDRDEVLEALRPWLERDGNANLVGQHVKYDANVLRRHGIELSNVAHDTMLESYVLDSTGTRHDMDSLSLKYLGVKTVKFEDVAGKGKKQVTFDKVPLDTAAHYAAEDADITLRLHRVLQPKLAAVPSLERLYTDIELPLSRVLSRIECNGVRIDTGMLDTQGAKLAETIESTQAEAWREAGKEFNLGSPKQIQEIFFDELQLPVIRKTPKGQPSTAEDVLEQLAADFRLPRLILEHRSLTKLKSTYIDKLPRQVDADTGRVHTSYNQAVASTGRLSSTDPNLQNIPIRTEEGRRIRQAFVAAEGYRLLAADYSQIELRIMAHLSRDEGLLDAFERRLDVHRATAAEVFGVPLDAVDNDQRRSAKAINFGLIYGMSAFGLAKQLDIPRGEAQEYIELYFSRYPGVKRYMDETRERARETGFVETVFGRRLYLPDINAKNPQLRNYAERTAINAPMQGTAADIIKRAMIAVQRWLDDSAVDARITMQVHDELVLEVAAGEGEAVAADVRERMTGAADLAVPLEVESGLGNTWEEAH